MSDVAQFDFSKYEYTIQNHDVVAQQIKPTSSLLVQRIKDNLQQLQLEIGSIQPAQLINNQNAQQNLKKLHAFSLCLRDSMQGKPKQEAEQVASKLETLTKLASLSETQAQKVLNRYNQIKSSLPKESAIQEHALEAALVLESEIAKINNVRSTCLFPVVAEEGLYVKLADKSFTLITNDLIGEGAAKKVHRAYEFTLAHLQEQAQNEQAKLRVHYYISADKAQAAEKEYNVALALKDCPYTAKMHALGVIQASQESDFPTGISMLAELYSVDFARADLSELEKVNVLLHAAQGVSALHQKEYVHLDIKAENIFIKQEGQTPVGILGDFDSAVINASKLVKDTRYQTPENSAPEMFGDEAISATPALDAWAFGMLLHKQFLGKSPDWVDDILAEGGALQEKVTEGAASLQEKRLLLEAEQGLRTVKQRQELLVYKLLHPDPQKRMTMQAATKELEQIIKEMTRATTIARQFGVERPLQKKSDRTIPCYRIDTNRDNFFACAKKLPTDELAKRAFEHSLIGSKSVPSEKADFLVSHELANKQMTIKKTEEGEEEALSFLDLFDEFSEKTLPDSCQVKDNQGNWKLIDQNTFKDLSCQLALEDSAFTFPENNEYITDPNSQEKRVPATSFLLGLPSSFQKLSGNMKTFIQEKVNVALPEGLLSEKAKTAFNLRASAAANYVKNSTDLLTKMEALSNAQIVEWLPSYEEMLVQAKKALDFLIIEPSEKVKLCSAVDSSIANKDTGALKVTIETLRGLLKEEPTPFGVHAAMYPQTAIQGSILAATFMKESSLTLEQAREKIFIDKDQSLDHFTFNQIEKRAHDAESS
jgi:serine/threonine protein kinase